MHKKTLVSGLVLFSFLFAGSVSAHVVVKPNQVGVGAFQSFSVGVPVEKSVPTVGLRLVIPEGLEYVTPNVKPGWKIQVKKDGTGEDAKVTEIIWTGGSIPAGQRDEFVFSAKVPASEGSIVWKAYQTYRDGTVVAWDQDPNAVKVEGSTDGPFSTTKIINDLAPVEQKSKTTLPIVLSIVSVVLAVIAIARTIRTTKA